uniref:Uncharacterized protein n=1 Tax=Attheya septentrionalis TaxID=420275 RepID=A0A7S2U8F8_9STRA
MVACSRGTGCTSVVSAAHFRVATTLRRLVFAIVLLVTSQRGVVGLSLDIHVPLRSITGLCAYNFAINANLLLRQVGGSDEYVDLFSLHVPHVTLFLTDFNVETIVQNGTSTYTIVNQTKLNELFGILQSVVTQHSQTFCRLGLSRSHILRGPYAMLSVLNRDCLQRLSNDVVQATQPFVTPGQAIPDWVMSLPEPERMRKIKWIQEYGSPNVFSDFDPHITVGYNTNVSLASRRQQALQQIVIPSDCSGHLQSLGVGKVGEKGGTVLESGILFTTQFNVSSAVFDDTHYGISNQ